MGWGVYVVVIELDTGPTREKENTEMSDAFVGADVAQLEGIASRLDTEHAVAIENVMTAVDLSLIHI